MDSQQINRKREALTRVEHGLPASWYRDPAHYERELEAFWYSRWVCVVRDEELAAAGDWRLLRLGTQSLILLRDEAGGLRAFHNTCRHRGSVLCSEERGRFARGRIVCPYHAWTYDLGGRLVATPRRMETPDFRPEEFSLYGVAAASWGGFVFVHLGKDPAPLAATIGDRAERYRRYGFADLRIGKRVVLDVAANWKLLAENFSECFHCPPVHPEFCRIVTAYQDAGAWGLRGGAEAKPEYKAGAQTLTLDGTARLPAFGSLSGEERARLYTADTVLPNLFLNVHPDYVNSQLMFPTGPQSVRMVYDWLFEARHLPLAEDDLRHYVALWDITNRQDARNCEWQQQGLQSREFRHGVYVPQEFDAHRFAEWVRAGLALSAPAAPSAR
ncbi:MAG TPA: aromatic ring-hydroxylating dioxygenase subunit alpha [Burkholderiales bacterium]|jgi:Rieske 2Fe-2S family protein